MNGERDILPASVPEAQALVQRLCRLQAEVIRTIDRAGSHPTDCFCGESGFWPLRSPDQFRNVGVAVNWIEWCVRKGLAEYRDDWRDAGSASEVAAMREP